MSGHMDFFFSSELVWQVLHPRKVSCHDLRSAPTLFQGLIAQYLCYFPSSFSEFGFSSLFFNLVSPVSLTFILTMGNNNILCVCFPRCRANATSGFK